MPKPTTQPRPAYAPPINIRTLPLAAGRLLRIQAARTGTNLQAYITARLVELAATLPQEKE